MKATAIIEVVRNGDNAIVDLVVIPKNIHKTFYAAGQNKNKYKYVQVIKGKPHCAFTESELLVIK
jgi:hypothetical protein